jgi:hypothetical protein
MSDADVNNTTLIKYIHICLNEDNNDSYWWGEGG